jgi:hypothetical protein
LDKADLAQRDRPRHQLHLRRQEDAKGDDGEHQRVAAEAPQRKRIAVDRADQRRYHRRRNRDRDR